MADFKADAKGALPDSVIDSGNDALARAFLVLMRLKRLYRRGWLRAGIAPERCETVAEHAFSAALSALFLAPAAGAAIDPGKAALLALAHELGETGAGDITPHDGVSREAKASMEREAVQEAFGALPEAAFLRSLWEEYESGSTPEARFVKAIDRFEMGMQALVYRSEGNAGMDEFLASALEATAGTTLQGILLRSSSASAK